MMRILATVGLTVVLAGCFPRTILDAPAYDLTIVDARTDKAISGAVVIVKGGRDPGRAVSGTTDASGHVDTTRIVHTAWLPLNFDLYVEAPVLTVSANGYLSHELDGFDPLFRPRACGPGEDCRYNWETVVDTAVITLDPK